MTDLPPDAGAPAPVDPAPDTGAPGAVAEPAPDAAGAPAPEGGEQDTFDRAYVEKLRDEAAANRVKAREAEEGLSRYTSAFEGADPSVQEAFLDLARIVISDPAKAGPKELINLARQLAQDEFDSLINSNEPEYLTAEQAEAKAREVYEKEKASEREKEALNAVLAEAKELGYEDGTFDNAALFWFAHQQTEGDLKKADTALKDYKQSIITEYVNAQKGVNSGYPPVTSGKGEGPADPGDGPPRSLEEASERARSRLAASLSE